LSKTNAKEVGEIEQEERSETKAQKWVFKEDGEAQSCEQ